MCCGVKCSAGVVSVVSVVINLTSQGRPVVLSVLSGSE